MTDSIRTLEIPIPEDALELLGFTEDGIFQADITEGKLVLTQKKKGVCVPTAVSAMRRSSTNSSAI